MLIPDLLNILFDQSDYLMLVRLASLNKRKTRYATKYSVMAYYDIFDDRFIKNMKFGCLKTVKIVIDVVDLDRVVNIAFSGQCFQIEIIKLLVHNGVDLGNFSFYGDLCVINKNAIKYLVSVGMHTGELLALASHCGYLDIVIFLMSIGADIHHRIDFALLESATSNNINITKYLVDHGANVLDNVLMMPVCAQRGYLEMVEYLVNEGFSIHTCNDAALRWSAEKNKLCVVKYLINKGVSLRGHVFECDEPTDTMRYLASIGADVRCNFTPQKNSILIYKCE